MDDIEGGAWFFTREGERIGPVSYADLRIKAANSELNPRLDMVWTQGMAEWKPAGEVEGLFERVAPVKTDAAPEVNLDPYEPPEHGSLADQGAWPGARRRSYLFVILILPFLISFTTGLATPFLLARLGEEITRWIALGSLVLPVLFMFHYAFQRLVNLGMSRWWIIGYVIPPVSIWVGYRCFACPAGYAFHKKMDGAGIFLAIIYWLVTLLALVALVAAVAVMMGAAGSPEIQQQFQDALRELQDARGASASPQP
ncbi:DUF4339 domain-containing protein [Luteolibacter yonseiensis]|uniref:DUF4339 domain-containing protein n=1 Tax=Luteolibacter yonseiensis TaxID=1144680 RepID=A0A934R3K4_9BACT|nr:DUF4339 domain-containing protein [Luteolibacter yonseiensis]MBK1814660.1 DUF4339 domain-containing protein [Luteolibacter yonseiensis]